jgi:hypothetical protein
MRPIAFMLSVLLTSLVLPARAAEPARTDPAAAEALFDEGRAALEAGQYQTACAKFAESQRLDPGAGTLLNWATCEEKLGKVASAWQHFEQARDALPLSDDRSEYALKHALELEQRVPTLTLEFAGAIPAGTVVLRDGILLRAASLSTPLPIDPGSHTIAVRARDHAERRYSVVLAEGEKRQLRLQVGPSLQKRDQPQPGKVLGFTLMGVGAAGVATGVVTSALVQRDKDIVERHCEDKSCDQRGLDAAERGHTMVIVNTVAWGVGALGVGSGLVLLLTQPSEPKREQPKLTASIGPRGALVGYGGRF